MDDRKLKHSRVQIREDITASELGRLLTGRIDDIESGLESVAVLTREGGMWRSELEDRTEDLLKLIELMNRRISTLEDFMKMLQVGGR